MMVRRQELLISRRIPRILAWAKTVICVVLLLVFAAACTAADTSDETEQADPVSPDQEEAEPEVEQVETPATLPGDVLTIVIPFGPGGGYDTDMQVLRPYFEEELGVSIVIEHQPGGGGLLAINNLLAAEADGMTLANMNGVGVASAVISGDENVQFELGELTFIGRHGLADRVLVSGADGPWANFEDLLETDVTFRFGAPGPGTPVYLDAILLQAVLGIDFDIITGFSGGVSETFPAVIRGDISGTTTEFELMMPFFEAGEMNPLLVIGEEARSETPGVPALPELDLDPEQLLIAHSWLDLLSMGRILVGPPGVPEDVRLLLEDAWRRVLENPDAIEAMTQADRATGYMSGTDVMDLAQRLLEPAPEFRSLLQESY